ncbi:hypothetical protein GLYMA_15G057850v4 [Glycine max]|nr:hypothetical protein GLYMA_15G057850v4 [Glycine max]KAH1145759.1 hypothetical protein GYH30_041464 [Glycine max]
MSPSMSLFLALGPHRPFHLHLHCLCLLFYFSLSHSKIVSCSSRHFSIFSAGVATYQACLPPPPFTSDGLDSSSNPIALTPLALSSKFDLVVAFQKVSPYMEKSYG